MMRLEFRDRTRFTGDHINNQAYTHANYLCLEDSNKNVVHVSKDLTL